MVLTIAPRRRLLHLLGAVALTLGLFGCGGGDHSPGAYVALDWSVADLGNPSVALYCQDVGAGNVVLTMTNQNTGAAYTNTFACSDGYYDPSLPPITSDSVPPGPYDITVSLYGDPQADNGATPLIDNQADTLNLVPGANDLGTLSFLANSFVLEWSISVGGVPSSCAAVGARWVELDVTFPGDSQATYYDIPCDDVSYRQATLAIPMGDYPVTWQAYLLDGGGNDVTPGTTLQSYNVSSSYQADLGTVYFAF